MDTIQAKGASVDEKRWKTYEYVFTWPLIEISKIETKMYVLSQAFVHDLKLGSKPNMNYN